jgi:hypothetical protein
MWKCDNCDKSGDRIDLDFKYPNIPDILARLSPGAVVPVGECPGCGALVYEGGNKDTKWKLDRDWRTRLRTGDEVTWNDPDNGTCTRTDIIASIRYIGDGESAVITWANGDVVEVFMDELS